MHRNWDLYTFFKENTRNLTEEWYKRIDHSKTGGVYASTDSNVIAALKDQNHEFHLHFIEVFSKDEEAFIDEFEPWIMKIASDIEHLNTPIHFIIKEFKNTRNLYLDYVKKFAETTGRLTADELEAWYRIIINEIDAVILRFIEATHQYSQKVFKAQQEMIHELSAPVISLSHGEGLLPLIGDIDTGRAKMILESTLKQCSERSISQLFIDLSGVVMIDTMVAHQLFQLLSALKLIGVKTTLSGIRPEIAQTAVHLGLSFDGTAIKANLASALGKNET